MPGTPSPLVDGATRGLSGPLLYSKRETNVKVDPLSAAQKTCWQT
jgi:hypothetical protein